MAVAAATGASLLLPSCSYYSIKRNLSCSRVPTNGLSLFSNWIAKKQLPNSRSLLRLRGRRRCRIVQASLLGVGAPEVIVIAVVALLVFGPKGLAEVARSLGKTLRAFQPTIRELQEVSRDFNQTLQKEIGLEEQAFNSISTTQQQPPIQQNGPTKTEDYLSVTEEQVRVLVPEEERKAAEAAAWGGTPPVKTSTTKPVNKADADEKQEHRPKSQAVENEQKNQTIG